MTASDYLLTRFGKLSLFRQTCVVVLAAIIGADTLSLVFYGIFFADRLLLDLFLTTVITVAVGFPLGYFILRQQLKLALMAAKLDRAARIDHLTSLANRKTFFEEAEAIVGSEAFKEGAVLFMDADHFKSINDTFGHAIGNAVLQEMGSVIRSSIRESDLAARIGGEEFAVFLVEAGRDKTLEVAERIRQNMRGVRRAVGIEDREITVSIGICLHGPGQTLDDILLRADQNLYVAKNRGRDCIVATTGFGPVFA
ncbi:GGDEF domain-containing protein [Mesorhizobium sp.]|uniref:GGDEF domain-containing protein n=1 Tax=Mesorhizobium sp. TaxID=1871066 RepID=UPI000FE478E9|nr:GGDEF domain-containing protein [Mesorhizobium sp.]RWQ58455.1 MAG: GGDEF domain-containing protein [Mesorhizobium sp.]